VHDARRAAVRSLLSLRWIVNRPQPKRIVQETNDVLASFSRRDFAARHDDGADGDERSARGRHDRTERVANRPAQDRKGELPRPAQQEREGRQRRSGMIPGDGIPGKTRRDRKALKGPKEP